MKTLIYIAVTLVNLPNIAQAYLVPVSGSAVMGWVMGLCLAVIMFFKTFWYKLKALVIGKKNNLVISEQAKEPAKHTQQTTDKIALPNRDDFGYIYTRCC